MVAGLPLSLFSPDYDRGLANWQGVQQPSGTQRITTVSAPGDPGDPYRPTERVMRAELRPGEVTNTGGYIAPRAEVYGRLMKPTSSPATLWPDPVNSVRWYAFEVFVPADFTTATDTKWIDITQWKGQYGGSPPIAVEIKRASLRIGGKVGALLPNLGDLGPLCKGCWTQLVVGIRHSPDPTAGWVEVYRDGVQKVARTPLATMDYYGSEPDPTYLKQGIYRTAAWGVTHVLYFSPIKLYDGGSVTDPQSLA